MPILRRHECRWHARLAGMVPGVLLTAGMLLVVAGSVRSRLGWLSFDRRSEPRAGERVVFMPTVRAAGPPDRGRGMPARTTRATQPATGPSAAPSSAPSSAPAVDAAPAAAPTPAPRPSSTASDAVDPRLVGPRGYVPPDVAKQPLRSGTPRPDHAPLDGERRDSALAAMRSELSALALRGRIPIGRDDAGKALAPLGAAGLSADARRDLARAAIVDWQRRDAEARVQERGQRPAVTVGFRLPLGGPRKPALSDAEVRAMVERNAARVRRRADSLRWWAESTRVARERVVRDAPDSAGAAPPVAGGV